MYFRFLFVVLGIMLANTATGEAGNRGDDLLQVKKSASALSRTEQAGEAFMLVKQRKRNSDIHVTMYMTSWCPYCKKARAYLNELGVRLTEYDVDQDAEKKDEMKRLSGGSTAVPVINIEGTVIRGYSPDAIRDAVEERKTVQSKG